MHISLKGRIEERMDHPQKPPDRPQFISFVFSFQAIFSAIFSSFPFFLYYFIFDSTGRETMDQIKCKDMQKQQKPDREPMK